MAETGCCRHTGGSGEQPRRCQVSATLGTRRPGATQGLALLLQLEEGTARKTLPTETEGPETPEERPGPAPAPCQEVEARLCSAQRFGFRASVLELLAAASEPRPSTFLQLEVEEALQQDGTPHTAWGQALSSCERWAAAHPP